MMLNIDEQLLIFVKNPRMGHVKTRLALETSPPLALGVYEKLLQYTKEITQTIRVTKSVWYDQKIDYGDLWPNDLFDKSLQRGEGLGARMHGAFLSSFTSGATKAVIIGSDCASITTEIIEEAFRQLDSHDAVIGPAEDGGYYLLGLRQPFEPVFLNKPWSTPSIFQLTISDFEDANMSCYQLEALSDIDTLADLKKSEWLYAEYLDMIKQD